MQITIIVPFEDAHNKTAIWAYEEETIDFRRQNELAARCTTAFAAMELKTYLCRICEQAKIVFESTRQAADYSIELHITDPMDEDDGFTLEPQPWGVRIVGQNRAGLLYGVYEFLRLQGIRWYAPGKDGDYVPLLSAEIKKPTSNLTCKPSMSVVRGFDFEGVSKESAALLLWMVRNRLNLCGYRPNTAALAQKLGMKFKIGGHIFEKMLDPDRRLADGATLWETHPNWYGLAADGRRIKEQALTSQFCVSQAGLREFLANELLALLKGRWRHADLIDIWGFDTWGNSCNCSDCIKRGNGSDQALFFLSSVRAAVGDAYNKGVLDHPVRLVMCAYEGTATISGPHFSIPQNLTQSGDLIVFYPINRCYAHNIADASCECNRHYMQAFNSWVTANPAMPIMVGEYYNVSKFEDLPLLFSDRIHNDIKTYHTCGARAITYMHLPMVNWAMRTITQNLYAQLCWDVNTDSAAFLLEYFSNWYGPYRAEMRSAYDLIERAWLYVSDWRAWGLYSGLTQLRQWDGAVPQEPLFTKTHNHFANSAQAIHSGRSSIACLQEALTIIECVQQQDIIASAQNAAINPVGAVNPIEARHVAQIGKYEMRIGEDRRLLLYGIDSLSILVELTAYHNALYLVDHCSADESWETIESLAAALDAYYIPINYEWPDAGLIGVDALTRTQVRELLRRCRKYRIEKGYALPHKNGKTQWEAVYECVYHFRIAKNQEKTV